MTDFLSSEAAWVPAPVRDSADRLPHSAGTAGSLFQVIDTIVAMTAATVGDGAVLWPTLGRPEIDRRPRVCHPDGAVARTVKACLSASPPNRPASPVRSIDSLLDSLLYVVPTALVVPVRLEGRHLGHLAVFSVRPTTGYGADDRDLLLRIADTAAQALDHVDRRTTVEMADAAPAVDGPEGTETAAERRRALDRMANLEDEERRTLGEAIHEAPIQRIVTGVVRLEYLRKRVDEHGQQVLDEVTDLLEESLDWLRTLIVVSLTPPDLEAGIGSALAALAHQALAGTGIRVSVLGPAHAELDRTGKLAVYRIFREGLLNIARHAQADHVTIRVAPRPDGVDFSLRDNGVGGVDLVPPGSRGLWLMATRAEAHDAHLSIDSPVSGGTTITVRFRTGATPRLPSPVMPMSIDGGAPVALPATPSVRRILVCDDQKDLRAAVRLVLADNPTVEVIGEATDGESCLREVVARRPDVLILDVSMPGGGPSLARAVKAAVPGCHIVVFSGRADAATQHAMMEAGADQYVVKSGRLRRLMEALDRVV